MNRLYKPGDDFMWNGHHCVVKHPYELSILCTHAGRNGGVFGVHVSEIPCKTCKGQGVLDADPYKNAPVRECDHCLGTGNYQTVIDQQTKY